MIVDIHPLIPIRGVINGVINKPTTLDLNLIKIKKCMMFGQVTYKNTLLTNTNVEDIYNNDLPTEEKKETKVTESKEEKIVTPVVEEKKEIVDEEVVKETEVPVEEETTEEVVATDEVKSNNNQQYSKKNKNKNQK